MSDLRWFTKALEPGDECYRASHAHGRTIFLKVKVAKVHKNGRVILENGEAYSVHKSYDGEFSYSRTSSPGRFSPRPDLWPISPTVEAYRTQEEAKHARELRLRTLMTRMTRLDMRKLTDQQVNELEDFLDDAEGVDDQVG